MTASTGRGLIGGIKKEIEVELGKRRACIGKSRDWGVISAKTSSSFYLVLAW